MVSALPTPAREYVVCRDEDKRTHVKAAPAAPAHVPPYGSRRGFVPRALADMAGGMEWRKLVRYKELEALRESVKGVVAEYR